MTLCAVRHSLHEDTSFKLVLDNALGILKSGAGDKPSVLAVLLTDEAA